MRPFLIKRERKVNGRDENFVHEGAPRCLGFNSDAAHVGKGQSGLSLVLAGFSGNVTAN